MEVNKVEKFEDLIAWQKARKLASRVYAITKRGEIARDFGLRDQLRRSAVSVMANIAEGFERHRLGEFHQFLSIAKASLAEVRSHLYVVCDAGYCRPDDLQETMTLALELSRIVGGLRASLSRQLHAHRASPSSSSPQDSALRTQD